MSHTPNPCDFFDDRRRRRAHRRMRSKGRRQGPVQRLQRQPHPSVRFKAVFKEHCDVDFWANSAFYSYKFLKPRDEGKGGGIHQCILKVQKAHRSGLLTFSGKCELLIRDYVPKGITMQDLSVLPRFWDNTKQARQDLLRAASFQVTLVLFLHVVG